MKPNIITKVDNHIAGTADKHAAAAITVADSGGNFTATDVEATLAELQDNIDNLVILVSYHGASTFNSTSGRLITHNLGTTAYRVSVTPTTNPNGYLGEVWVGDKLANSCKVYNGGSNVTASFDILIIKD